jgi:hypothetical protein
MFVSNGRFQRTETINEKGAVTMSIMTIGIMTLSIMTLGIMTLGIMH